MVAADLVAALSADGPLTVFAPTNAAFADLLGELGVTKEALLASQPLLTQVLTYHVVPGKVMAADVKAGKVKTVQGAELTVSTMGGVKMALPTWWPPTWPPATV